MLFTIDGERITEIPHLAQYQSWKLGLTIDEFEAICADLNSRIDGDAVHTSSWIPGRNWGGSVFEPIYVSACGMNEEAAAKCFGLILWEVMTLRAEAWAFGRYEKDGIKIEGMTYFRVPGYDRFV